MTANQVEPNSSAHSCKPLTAAEVLGVPFIPPGAVAMSGARVRAALARVQAAMAPPPLRILEGLFGMLDHRVLVELCEIGVPDALTRPTTVADLGERVGAEVDMLERMLRFAATRGWVKIDRRGRVKPTKVTAFLRTDHPGGWRAWVEFAGGHEVVAAVGAMSVRQGRSDGFAQVNGAPFFEWMAAHPDRWATFDQAMAAGGRMHALTLVAALDWSATRSVCDVGGGTGELLACLLDLLPELNGTVLDLPDVVGRSVEHPRLTTVGGDAFVEVPSGFDTYLLVNVLHDWSDEDAGRILGRVVNAAGGHSRVIVVDNDRPTVPLPDVSVGADVLMAALTAGGLERGPKEFARLGEAYGLSHDRSVRLASGDFAHVFLMTDRNVVPADTTRGRCGHGLPG
jgi:2,7-dihydroxy-5-methyl-1-naphthoate 7-O-methyltransferase